jgi:ATP-dependent Zn protease
MITANRGLRRAGAARRMMQLVLAVPCVLGATLIVTAASAGAATIEYEPVSETVFLHELDSGQVASVKINRIRRAVRVTLKDGSHVTYKYAKRDEPHTRTVITSRGVPVTVLTQSEARAEIKSQPVHHKIRYIVGGVLIAVIVVVAAVLLIRRRGRRREEEAY